MMTTGPLGWCGEGVVWTVGKGGGGVVFPVGGALLVPAAVTLSTPPCIHNLDTEFSSTTFKIPKNVAVVIIQGCGG